MEMWSTKIHRKLVKHQVSLYSLLIAPQRTNFAIKFKPIVAIHKNTLVNIVKSIEFPFLILAIVRKKIFIFAFKLVKFFWYRNFPIYSMDLWDSTQCYFYYAIPYNQLITVQLIPNICCHLEPLKYSII